MLIVKEKKFIQADFESELELETVVFNNFEHIFGPNSFNIPKSLIRTSDGFGTIPDGFSINVPERNWYIVEVELYRHGVWNHIAPQISKQIISAQQSLTKQLLAELAINMIRDDNRIKNMFLDENILDIDIRKVIDEILESNPIIGIPIDNIPNDLRDWAQTLEVDVKLWTVKKYVEFGNEDSIIYELPEEYRPEFETAENRKIDQEKGSMTKYDVSIQDLISYGHLNVSEKLSMSYKGNSYDGFVQGNGSILTMGKKISSPSYAALAVIQSAGSKRQTVNGWTSWQNKDGLTLFEIRENYLQEQDEKL